MKKNRLLVFIIILFLILSGVYVFNTFYSAFYSTEPFSGFTDNNTLIISSATGEMRALEVGVAGYAANKNIPLILKGKDIPYPLNEWLPKFIKDNKIKKVVIIGSISGWELYQLKTLNVTVEKLDGSSKPEILVKLAEKNYKSIDTVIITPSNPSASYLGALMNVPVFVLAESGKYTSLDKMPSEYSDFILKHHVKSVISVGPVPSNIITDLKSKNITVEEINGDNSFETSLKVSDKIIEIQKAKGITPNSTFIGYYGELPSLIPLIFKDHALIIEDPANHVNETVSYLKKNNIDKAIITRNSPASYLQMEEPDFVPANVADKLTSNGIEITYLTNFRTINEATGLYETKMMGAALLLNSTKIVNSSNQDLQLVDKLINLNIVPSQYPPLLDMTLKGGTWKSDKGHILTVNRAGYNHWTYVWRGIHPYTWENNGESWYCDSNSNYTWNWSHVNDTWVVDYLSNGNPFYRVYWVKRGDIWLEIHPEGFYEWVYKGNSWICTKNDTKQSFVLYHQSYGPIFNF
ncbi:MAG TPA: hypothetical protein VK444_02515 [Methanobacteriaceae archaeon]|nr:hypothetical protein [Methanobacteriaceae archaeon]